MGEQLGTEIHLEVGGIAVDWAKNRRGSDHGVLFQDADRKRVRSESVDYEYYEQHGLDPAPMEEVFGRPLGAVVPRLELLGYTLEVVRQEYLQRAEMWQEEKTADSDTDQKPPQSALSFDELVEFVQDHALASLDDTFVLGSTVEDRRRTEGRFEAMPITGRIPYDYESLSNAYSERTYFGGLLDFLRPYSLLRLLAENPSNRDLDVVWDYGPLVDSGWAGADEFVAGTRRTQTVLIATEGTSDVHILRRAFELLQPDVADFFKFIDVSERHPFSGTGSLAKFAEGLAKIDVHNNVLFVFDNDAEGADAHEQVQRFKLPANMRAMLLPELEEFRQFDAKGPEGLSKADINRRAAAIECYLDLNLPGRPSARVIWTNYKKDANVYQGALEFKESYVKAFFDATDLDLQNGSYDVRKLKVVLSALLTQSVGLAEAVELSTA